MTDDRLHRALVAGAADLSIDIWAQTSGRRPADIREAIGRACHDMRRLARFTAREVAHLATVPLDDVLDVEAGAPVPHDRLVAVHRTLRAAVAELVTGLEVA